MSCRCEGYKNGLIARPRGRRESHAAETGKRGQVGNYAGQPTGMT